MLRGTEIIGGVVVFPSYPRMHALYIKRNDHGYFGNEWESIFIQIDKNIFVIDSNVIIAVTYRMPDLPVSVCLTSEENILGIAYSALSHSLDQWWAIVNWTLRNKLQWNFDQNKKVFNRENPYQTIICEMTAILSRGRWVNSLERAWASITIEGASMSQCPDACVPCVVIRARSYPTKYWVMLLLPVFFRGCVANMDLSRARCVELCNIYFLGHFIE